jgi:hypothetical protein
MFHRVLVTAVLASLALTSAAEAQQAAQAPGPLIEVTRSREVVLSVSDLPETTPNSPVDFWEWHFLASPVAVGETRFDTLAIRRRTDCSSKTMQAVSSERYLNGIVVLRTGGGPTHQVAAGTLPDNVMTIVCDPHQRAFKSEHPNWRLARESADWWFMDQ